MVVFYFFFFVVPAGRVGRLAGGVGSGFVIFDEWGGFFFFQCDSVVLQTQDMKSEVLSFFFFVMTQEMKPVRVISFSGGIFPKIYPLPVLMEGTFREYRMREA